MATETYIAGSDVTPYVQEGSVSEHHNTPDQSTVRLPVHTGPSVDLNSVVELDVVVEGSHRFHGEIEYGEYDGDENERYVAYTAIDPTFMNLHAIVCDADGDYTKPTIIEDNVSGPQIYAAAVANWESNFGPIGYSLGSVATGGIDLTGAPTNWPKMIYELQTMLVETGELDVVYHPASNTVSLWNGDYGADLSGSVRFEYDAAAHNARRCRVSIDKKELKTRMRYLLGPRVGTSDDPAGDQHWRGSIDLTTVSIPHHAAVSSAAAASEAVHRIRHLIRIFDARGDEATVGRELFKAHFSSEMWMRLQPKVLFHITPNRGIAPNFTTGDLIYGSGYGLGGVQRVMDMTYRWTADGPIELGEPVGQAGPRAFAVVATGMMEGLS